jgi:glutathione reductase (NADPH)
MSTTTSTTTTYDYVVLGGGSGGISSAKRAATYGKKVAVIEQARLGGTCVNVGCVPKKIMWSAATMADMMKHDASQYCFNGMPTTDKIQFDWNRMKKKRDAYILKLNHIYGNGLDTAGVDFYQGEASFVDANSIQIKSSDGTTTTTIQTKHTLIATGGRPHVPTEPGVQEYTISSDGFFELEQLPETVVVVGAGYIAVELAGVLNSLGSKTHLAVRKHRALRNFDPDISAALDEEMQKAGIIIHRNTAGVKQVSLDDKQSGTKTVTLVNGEVIEGANVVIMAPGRLPNTEGLNLEGVGVELNAKGFIQVDEYQNTSADNIFALGDVCGRVELTPMAIAAGRRLSDRLFGGMKDAKVSYEEVPTVVFSHPTIGTIGLTEPQAIQKYGADNIKIYRSKFANLYYGIFDSDDLKSKTTMKLITAGVNELVVGVHVIGMGADEMMQGFGIAVKMGATKADFDSAIAIHPTAAEELVTMGAWGTSPQISGAIHSPLMGAPPAEPTLSKM